MSLPAAARVARRHARLSLRVSARPCEPSGLQDRVVVLHRQPRDGVGPSVRLSGDVLSRGRRSLAGESLALGGSRPLHDASRRLRSVGNRYRFEERLNRGGPGLAGAATDRLSRVERRLERLAGRGGRTSCIVAAAVGVELVLDEGKAPAVNGVGWDQSEGRADRQRVALLLADPHADARWHVIDGERFEATGESWMDHEFGTSFLEAEQQGWDWLSMQLADGRELMLYQLRRGDGSRDPRSSGTLVEASAARVISARAISRSPRPARASARRRVPPIRFAGPCGCRGSGLDARGLDAAGESGAPDPGRWRLHIGRGSSTSLAPAAARPLPVAAIWK